MAKMNAKTRAGMQAITRRHLELLHMVQLVPGRLTDAHANIEGQEHATTPAFELTVALESARSADPGRLNQMSMQATAELLLNPNISEPTRQLISRTVHHCAMANASLGSAHADLASVRFNYRPMPAD